MDVRADGAANDGVANNGAANNSAANNSAANNSAANNSAANDAGCHILHVDMDAFYASVEVRDRPDLTGKPVIVGGLSGRGVVLSATYEARAFGVRSAMPMTRARRLCPQATVIPPRHGVYGAVSKEVMAIFRAVTPHVEPLSLDEAFLDVSGGIRLLGSPSHIGELIRRQVAEQQQITCSVGIAATKFLAKLASVHCKPDGLLVIPVDGALEFLHPLPVSALWGVGAKTGQVLARLGLVTVGDIARTPLSALERDLGKSAAAHLQGLAQGRDDRRVESSVREKSVGAEETFEVDISDPALVRRELLRMSRRTVKALRSGDLAARTITIKLRKADFSTITRSRTLPEPTSETQQIYATACELYLASGLSGRARLRLVGVRATGLVPAAAATQLTLQGGGTAWRQAESALDRITGRFGPDAIRPATLLDGRRAGRGSTDRGQ
ncbi:MAG: DNA polymerase IV [Actinobacteria bacterium]|nr:DNA polymerase IV [Actinomycetota bacterium]